MNDDHEPSRLDTMSEAPAFLREALGAARSQRPVADDLARLAGKLTAATGVVVEPPGPGLAPDVTPGAAATSAGGGVASAWWTSSAMKIGIALLVVGGGTAGLLGALVTSPVEGADRTPPSDRAASTSAHDPGDPRRAGASALAAPQAAESAAPPVAAEPSVSMPLRARRIAMAPSASASSVPSLAGPAQGAHLDGIEPETVLLERARRQLASSPSATLSATEQHARSYPRGALSQEREVLAIEALVGLGQRAEARRRADAFRAHHPRSVYQRRLDRLIDGDTSDQNLAR